MNEVQWLQAELAAEREHLREITTRASASGEIGDLSEGFTETYNDYIMLILRKEQARARAHLGRFDGARPFSPAEHAAIERLQGALASAEAAAAAHLGPAVEALIESRTALEALVSSLYTVDDWRRTAQINADSILEERRLRARVLQHLAGASTR